MKIFALKGDSTMLWMVSLVIIILVYTLVETWIEFGFVATVFTFVMIVGLVAYGVSLIDSGLKKILKWCKSVVCYTLGVFSK